jgi:hypothetical protein
MTATIPLTSFSKSLTDSLGAFSEQWVPAFLNRLNSHASIKKSPLGERAG